jgi:hypothetical protein
VALARLVASIQVATSESSPEVVALAVATTVANSAVPAAFEPQDVSMTHAHAT